MKPHIEASLFLVDCGIVLNVMRMSRHRGSDAVWQPLQGAACLTRAQFSCLSVAQCHDSVTLPPPLEQRIWIVCEQ